MSTVDNKAAIAQLLRDDGKYPDDPQLAIIYSYLTLEGNLTAAIYYPSDILLQQIYEFLHSPFVREPSVLWAQGFGITQAGEQWIQNFG
jgi:hypothetical protein